MNRNYVPVEDKPGLVRDIRSGAVISINNSDEIAKAQRAKQARRDQIKQQAQLREDVDNLKNDVQDIKSLLTKLVEKL
jgi:hypothetical protein